MASLHSSIDLWQSLSMSAYEVRGLMVFVFNVVHICFQAEPSKLTLTDFLIKHEGQPCIVVLDVGSTFNDSFRF